MAAIDRRTVLMVGAAAVLTACGRPTTASTPGDPSASPTSASGGDEATRATVAAAERALIAAYDAAIAASDAAIAAGGGAALEAIRAQHADHLAAMGVPTPSADSSPSSTVAPTIAELAAAERRAARDRADACVAATDPALVRTLALIAASEQSHAAALARAGSA